MHSHLRDIRIILLVSLLLLSLFVIIHPTPTIGDSRTLRNWNYYNRYSPGTLVGLTNGGLNQFGMVDPMTGNFTRLFPPMKGQAFQQGIAAWNWKSEEFYTISQSIVGDSTYMIAINARNGHITRNISLPFAPFSVLGYGHYLEFDSKTGNALAFGRSGDPRLQQQHVMLKIESDNEILILTQMNDTNSIGEVLPGAAALDTAHRLLWVLGAWDDGLARVIAYDIDNGTRVATIDDNPMVSSMSYDSKTGDLFGIGMRPDPFRPVPGYMFSLIRIQTPMHQHHIINVMDLPQFYDVLLGIGTVDSGLRLLYVVLKLSPGQAGRTVSGRMTGSAMASKIVEQVSDDFDYTLVAINIDTGIVHRVADPPCGYWCPGALKCTTT